MGNPELHEAPTPFLVIDLDVVAARYRDLRAALPAATVLYAVKANPTESVVRLLAAAGASFDVASPGEIALCLHCGVSPARLSYGNTLKKERDIAVAFAAGVRAFAVDAEAELAKVLRVAPGSTVYVRIATDGAGADWPLSRKFGCSLSEADGLLRAAAAAGHPVGVSFHVGSQQRNPGAWRAPLAQIGTLARALSRDGIVLTGVNLGGGLPSSYQDPVPTIDRYGSDIQAAVAAELGPDCSAALFVEPGRYLVGDAGVIEAEVILISERSGTPAERWVYLDIGVFNGLAETLGEAIRYRVRVPGRSGAPSPVVLAGPTCDSADILYEKDRYLLPADLAIGDRVQLLSTGAYTASYSTVGFNGFEPLRSYVVGGGQRDASAQPCAAGAVSHVVPDPRHPASVSRVAPE